ncbi:MAG TPA: peptidylprolyl isomerase [Nitrospiria bacterium]
MKVLDARIILATALTTAILAACSRSNGGASPDTVLARVNNTSITEKEFKRKWSALSDSARRVYSDAAGKKDFLDELIQRELLLQKARALKLDKDPAYLDHVEGFGQRLLLQSVIQETVEKSIDATDAEIADYFQTHRAEFPAVEELQASHILTAGEPEARRLRDRIRGGEDFRELARLHSLDAQTRNNGGSLGAVRRGRLVPEFERAAFALKSGQVSEPVRTAYGYHIIRVDSRRRFTPKDPADVRDELRRAVMGKKETSAFQALIRSLRTEARIVISDSSLAALDVPMSNSTPNPPVPTP